MQYPLSQRETLKTSMVIIIKINPVGALKDHAAKFCPQTVNIQKQFDFQGYTMFSGSASTSMGSTVISEEGWKSIDCIQTG